VPAQGFVWLVVQVQVLGRIRGNLSGEGEIPDRMDELAVLVEVLVGKVVELVEILIIIC